MELEMEMAMATVGTLRSHPTEAMVRDAGAPVDALRSPEPVSEGPPEGDGLPDGGGQRWRDVPPARQWHTNRAGRAMAMSFLTPLSAGGRMRLWLRLTLYRYGFGIFGRTVYSLSFLHYAHWSVVRRLPGRPGRHRSGYLLFESNYNGPWHNYIETFSAVVGGGIGKIMRTSSGFPGVKPVDDFKDYLEGHEYVVGHYYSAYERFPEASASVVTAALDLEVRLERFAHRARRMGAAEFGAALDAFLAGAQRSLGGGSPKRVPRRLLAGRARSVTVLAPIRAGHAPHLADVLARFEADGTSPLAAVEEVHLARWAILEWAQEGARPGAVRPLDPPCLLFTADVQGGRRAFLRRLVSAMVDATDDVWGHCDGWPGVDDPKAAARYLSRRRVRTHLFFAAYGRYGTADVVRALGGRRRLLAFVQDFQGRPDADRLEGFQQLVASASPS